MGSLLAGEPSPAVVSRRTGRSRFLIVCEHASNKIPRSLGTLGLSPDGQASHIAWDIGAEAVAQAMSRLLDAPLVVQRYSRLAFDCNRPPDSPAGIVDSNDGIEVPGNRDVSDRDRQARVNEIYVPFHAALTELIDERAAAGLGPVLVTVHSFSRVFQDQRRAVDLGIIHDDDLRLADALYQRCRAWKDVTVAQNEPYTPADGVTHTLVKHALPRGLLNVMLEVGSDLIDVESTQAAMAARLCAALEEVLPLVGGTAAPDAAAGSVA
ncbi:MAG: N-formylglutamate amidohydrolase [Alphaproteobacteria bacterium]|nr:N-formylglutamate amidohydrolase [Alphaproteobacteria bacterium]